MNAPTLAKRVGSLPTSLTTFVGRSRELTEVAVLLRQPEIRLLTVTGPGGVGKTRLAVQAATEAAEFFRDGVCYVALGRISNPELLIPAIAQALGIQKLGTGDALQRLESFLRDRQCLLVLDNFEQVVESAPMIPVILGSCSGLSILVTSRVRLRISGEHQYPLAPLGVNPNSAIDDEHALPDSVRLFVERARAVQPGFAINDDNVESIFRICKRLDGLPLAIELAAARINLLPVASLLARLEKTLPLLTGGARDLPTRQQTMRDTIAWSYDLLSEQEQRTFRRLSPLCCGFSFEVLEPVVSLDGDAEVDVLEIVTSLVDKSLMQLETGTAGDTRYVMLETIREFALECLLAAGEEEQMLARHADRFLRFAVDVQPHLMGERRDQALWLKRIDDELGNIRIALDYFESVGDAASLLRAVYALDFYFTSRTAQMNTDLWQELALDPENDLDSRLRVEALFSLAFFAAIHDRHDDAQRCVETALRTAQTSGNPLLMGISTSSLGMVTEFAGEGAQAARFYLDAVPHFRASEPSQWFQYALAGAGDMLNWCGEDLGRARLLVEEAITMTRGTNDVFGLAVFQGYLAHIARNEGDFDSAIRLFLESYQLSEEIGTERISLGAIAGLAGVAFDLGQPERAARWLGAIDAVRDRAGVGKLCHSLHTDRITASVRERIGDTDFLQQKETGRRMRWNDVRAEALGFTSDAGPDVPPVVPSPNPYGLTSRERDVLRLLVDGQSDKEIAEALFIGSRTVQTHVANLIAKLNVHNRAEAAVVAVRQNLL